MSATAAEEKPIDREQLVRLFQEIVRNDATTYDHHQARRWDRKKPADAGGTIWLTPREMARQALRHLGAPIPEWGE